VGLIAIDIVAWLVTWVNVEGPMCYLMWRLALDKFVFCYTGSGLSQCWEFFVIFFTLKLWSQVGYKPKRTRRLRQGIEVLIFLCFVV